MSESLYSIKLIAAGILAAGFGVSAIMSPFSKEIKEVGNLGIPLLIVGLALIVLGIVILFPRSRKKTTTPAKDAEPGASPGGESSGGSENQ